LAYVIWADFAVITARLYHTNVQDVNGYFLGELREKKSPARMAGLDMLQDCALRD
jgi:hypothetical protein